MNGRKTLSISSHSGCTLRPGSGPLSSSRRSLGSGAVGDCGRQLHPGRSRQAFLSGEGMFWPTVADIVARFGMADCDALQHAERHPRAPGIDVQAADASAVTSDAPTSAAKAIDERRSLFSVIGMVPSRNSQSPRSRALGD